MPEFFNKSRTIRLYLTSEMFDSIEVFWLLERKRKWWIFSWWESIDRVKTEDIKACLRRHKLKPPWQFI